MSGNKNVVVVGGGRWGKNLARNFHELGALHTICDPNESVLNQYQKQYPDISVTSNYSAVLENPLLTRIVISAPAALHYELTKQALIARKDVYVEKPLCLNCHEAEELIQLAKDGGQILMVGHILQYHPCVKRLQELVGAGELGKLQYVVSNRLNLGAIRTEENALWDLAPHDVSVILSLCGQSIPYRVKCLGGSFISPGVADIALTTMRFENGIRAHIYVSWLNPYKEQKLVVVGSHGMAVFDDTKPWNEKLLLYRNNLKWTNGTIPHVEQGDAEKIDIPPAEPLKEECLHFLKCCDERIEPRTDGEEGMRVLKVLEAAHASLTVDGTAKDPRETHIFNRAPAPDYDAHSSAVIDATAEIGNGTKIGHFTHIMNGAKVGQFCQISENVVIPSGVVCENHVFLGPNVVFTNIKNPRQTTTTQEQKTCVKNGATIGAQTTIVTGTTLAEYCFVEAGSVVTEDVAPYALISGNPGKQIGWVSREGQPLDLPVSSTEEMTVVCPVTQETYILKGNTLSLKEELAITP